jgi:hypothetical protein
MGKALRANSFSAVAEPEDMAAKVMKSAPASDAEALKLLRARFPDCPLSTRVAALDVIMRHGQRSISRTR